MYAHAPTISDGCTLFHVVCLSKIEHTLAPKSLSKPLFLCICAWRSASCAIDMSMSPLLICAVCLKFVGTPIMLRSILSLWCCLPLFRLLFLVACGVKQHVKHCTQSSLLPAILWYPRFSSLENRSLQRLSRVTSKEVRICRFSEELQSGNEGAVPWELLRSEWRRVQRAMIEDRAIINSLLEWRWRIGYIHK